MISKGGPATATLAEIYLGQGLVGRARAIYRQLAEAGDVNAQRRLLELGPSAGLRIKELTALLEQIQQRRRRL